MLPWLYAENNFRLELAFTGKLDMHTEDRQSFLGWTEAWPDGWRNEWKVDSKKTRVT